jgi:mRNA interferase HigB
MLLRFAQKHPDSLGPLLRWHSVVEDANWDDFAQTRAVFPHADQVRLESGRIATVFNIGGNKYRLIAAIHYNRQLVFVMRVYTHKEYDSVDWAAQL